MFISQKISGILGLIILLFLVSVENGFSFSIARVPETLGKPEPTYPDYFKASVFVKMSAREFGAVTGRKLNIFEKIYFKIVQHEVKRKARKNPDMLVTDYLQENGKFKLSLLWFVIAAFIGPFGVLLAYTSPHRKQDLITRKDKITSAWLGFLLFALWFGWLFVF